MLGQLDDNARLIFSGMDLTAFTSMEGEMDMAVFHPMTGFSGLAVKEGKPLIEYIAATESWKPRKQFYEHAQIMKFIKPGSVRIGITGQDSNLFAYAFRNPDGKFGYHQAGITATGLLLSMEFLPTFRF